MGQRRARMWGGGMPGLGAGRDERRRRAGTWGVGPSCRADGVEVCLADGAAACQDLGRRPAGPMGRRRARTRGVPGCGVEVCRDEGPRACRDERRRHALPCRDKWRAGM